MLRRFSMLWMDPTATILHTAKQVMPASIPNTQTRALEDTRGSSNAASTSLPT